MHRTETQGYYYLKDVPDAFDVDVLNARPRGDDQMDDMENEFLLWIRDKFTV